MYKPVDSIVRAAILLLCFQFIAVLTVSEDERETKRKLNDYCRARLSFKTIERFNKFVRFFKRVEEVNVYYDKSLSHLEKCHNEADAIFALHELVMSYDKERPCKYSEVTKMEEFAKKYLLNNPTSLTLKFFTLFGVSVGINCRINLLAHLKQADSEAEQLDFIYSMASPTGWKPLINEHTKKSMKYGTSSHQDSNVINRIAKLIPGLSQIDHLDYMNFNHVKNDVESSQYASREQGSFEMKNPILKPQVVESLYIIIESCKNLDKFYVNSVLSMAKLKGLGLMVDFLNDLHDRSALLHKWLVATSFCQLMVRVEILTDKMDNSGPHIKYEITHSDKLLESRRELYSYAAPFEEIHERAYELAYQATVQEGSWRRQSEAMWVPTKERPATSIATKLLVQFMKGVENDFQLELDSE